MTTTAEPLEGLRRHKLMPADVRQALPDLRSTDGQGMDAMARVKFFAPASRYTLFVTEFDGTDLLYGWCVSPLGADCDEWGYSNLQELAEAAWNGATPMIERDCFWTARPVGECIGPAT
jgi:Protein of unknown function (DUF2958)